MIHIFYTLALRSNILQNGGNGICTQYI